MVLTINKLYKSPSKSEILLRGDKLMNYKIEVWDIPIHRLKPCIRR